MKIHLANHSEQKIGGGWTFLNNFKKYLERLGAQLVPTDLGADIIFISGATMVDRNFVSKNKAQGKKIVLRVDNIPRNSRNRNTGTSRLFDIAQMADLVIYQSRWAKEYIEPFIKKDGPVILNGADTEIFNDHAPARPTDGSPQVLYTRFNRDETKRWDEAWYEYIHCQRLYPKAHLWIVGQFSPELVEYGFDFFQGERFEYLGVIDDPAMMAEIYRGASELLLPYYNDACSNTLIEYRLCRPAGVVHHNDTGGTPEIMEAELSELTADHMTKRYLQELSKL